MAFFVSGLLNRRPSFALQATEGRQMTDDRKQRSPRYRIRDLSDFHPANRNARPETNDQPPETSLPCETHRATCNQIPVTRTHFPTNLL